MSRLGLLWQLGKAKRNARLPRAKIEQLQQKKLRGLLHYAYHHSSYYHDSFTKAGITEANLDKAPFSHSRPLTNAFCWIDSVTSSPSKVLHRKTCRDLTKQPELTVNHIWKNITWCIPLAVPENRDISFMIIMHGTPCSSVLSGRHCGICPCHRL